VRDAGPEVAVPVIPKAVVPEVRTLGESLAISVERAAYTSVKVLPVSDTVDGVVSMVPAPSVVVVPVAKFQMSVSEYIVFEAPPGGVSLSAA
jgi:hypothetical protein